MTLQKESLSRWLLTVAVIEGILASFSLFLVPSESKSRLLFGLSASRLIVLAGCAALILVLVLILLLREGKLKLKADFLENKSIILIVQRVIFALLAALFLICAAVFILYWVDTQNYETLMDSLVARYWGVLLWGMLLAIQLGLIILSDLRNADFLLKDFFSPLYCVFLLAVFTLIFYSAFDYYDRTDWDRNLQHTGVIFLLPLGFALGGVISSQIIRQPALREKSNALWFSLLLVASLFSFYRLCGYWVMRLNTPSKAYWHELAEAFTQGRLYLINPATTHDLTQFNGHWYVPNPPLPAILLMPFVSWLGVENVNMTVVSALLGALNALVIYWVLRKASAAGMISCNHRTVFWLTLLFAVGTNHGWLALIGQMWFVSQLFTILMTALAVLSAIAGWSGWLTGAFFGLALLARPNVFPIALLLLGIRLWQTAPFPKIIWRDAISWSLKAAIPACLAVFLLLYYNYVRFEDWFDFGYVTIHGAPWILEAVQTYGMFHPHFFQTNLNVMLFKLPRLDFSGERFFFQPGISGFSIFAMTPPLICLYRSFRRNWWGIGAWLSVLLTLLLLLFYHNTGAEQVGYRYLMDAIVPIMLLLGLATGEKSSWMFKFLTVLGILINMLSIHWWFLGRV